MLETPSSREGGTAGGRCAEDMRINKGCGAMDDAGLFASGIVAPERQLRVAAMCQSMPPLFARPLSYLFHFLLSRDWGMAFAPLVAFGVFGDWRSHDFMLSVALSGLVCGVVKHILRTPRPSWVSTDVRLHADETTWSTPSAHAATGAGGAFVFFFHALADESAAAIVGSAASMILTLLLVGFSRVYLGVHWLQDVALGSLLGLGSGALVTTSALHERLAAHVVNAPTAQAAALAYVVPGLAYLLGVSCLVMMLHALSEIKPISWTEQRRYRENLELRRSLANEDHITPAGSPGMKRLVPHNDVESSQLARGRDPPTRYGTSASAKPVAANLVEEKPTSFFADRKEKFWFNAWSAAGAYFGIATYVAVDWSAAASSKQEGSWSWMFGGKQRHEMDFVDRQEKFAWLAAIFATGQTILLIVLLRHWLRHQLPPTAFSYLRQAVYLFINFCTFGLFPIAYCMLTKTADAAVTAAASCRLSGSVTPPTLSVLA